mmetsp:Transcript_57430/g.159865  ORF Transcript_57430/g.159865 Transcript_57430/m.159865 type:complete len:270 (+) Transcript_57430:1366-2175(+)
MFQVSSTFPVKMGSARIDPRVSCNSALSLSISVSYASTSSLWSFRQFFFTLLMIFLARDANCNVDVVSLRLQAAGEMLQMMQVLALPPSECDSKCVSLESRKGTCFPSMFFSESMEMQRASIISDVLMWAASLRLAPVVPVLDCRSDPAKSTRLRRPMIVVRELVCAKWMSGPTNFVCSATHSSSRLSNAPPHILLKNCTTPTTSLWAASKMGAQRMLFVVYPVSLSMSGLKRGSSYASGMLIICAVVATAPAMPCDMGKRNVMSPVWM